MIKPYWSIRGFGLQTVAGNTNHLFRCITGGDRDTAVSEKKCVFSGTTIELKYVVSALEGLCQHAPHNLALSTSDRRSRKNVVIGAGHLIKDKGRRKRSGGEQVHASTSIKVECKA